MTEPRASHRPGPRPSRVFLGVLALAACAAGADADAQDLDRCVAAERYLTEQLGMVAEIGPDTLEDWRTDRTLVGCRVTAAGSTPLDLRDVSGGLYSGLFATGWERTPDPQDAPAESSLRLRLGDTDCLFSLYDNIAIGTAAELRVSNAIVIPRGEQRFNVLAQCFAAEESAG
ncbi:MAG: hypothetical protein ACYTG4_15450 [Planctomycetota bacterium]|jgi:hypothetical protein